MIVVDDPSIWESHIKDNSEWAKFKKDGFPRYPELCFVFDDIYATKEHTIGNTEVLMASKEHDNGGGDADDDSEDFSEHHIDEGFFASDNTATPVHDEHKLDRTPTIKRRRSNSFNISNPCKAIREMFKYGPSQFVSGSTSQFMSGSTASRVTSPHVDTFSVSAVIDVLVSMPKLEQDLYNKAMEQTCISATWREAFIASPIERRNGLLQYLK
ncbi:uncharacterized protein LOC115739711 [Rhodamnia argentea]|uniref:Uncharacterized protein LOC115739711 n=1 Tax=Rhodamnia argentea TaxID=178133 RepID=A0ABM3HWD6_9MYRT|nr:uncharacterized protein LOC115739711 [Rhodamnia argentea]